MMTDSEIIKEIKSWRGTPWKHCVALKGWGADCGQFVVTLCRTFGWIPADYKLDPYHADYSMHNNKSLMREALERSGADELEDKNDLQIGDVLLFKNGQCEAHVGMAISPTYFVHCQVMMGVVTDPLTRYEKDHISTWRFPNV